MNAFVGAQFYAQSDKSSSIHLLICMCCVCVSAAVVLTSCDFNQDSEPFCRFSQDTADDGQWIRNRGPTPTNPTGPGGDYPDGSQS